MFLDLKTRISLEFVIRIQHLRCLRKADTRDKLIRVVICHGKNKRMPQSHFLCKKQCQHHAFWTLKTEYLWNLLSEFNIQGVCRKLPLSPTDKSHNFSCLGSKEIQKVIVCEKQWWRYSFWALKLEYLWNLLSEFNIQGVCGKLTL